jgi:exopolyphosphatase
LQAGKTRWILVDHNALQGELGKLYSNHVRGCIDHHDEENSVPKETGDEPRIVRKSGSCASLVVEYCRQAWDNLAAESAPSAEVKKWDAEIARLALAPVLMDTTNFTVESRTTDTDRGAAAYLRERISAFERGFDPDGYFEEIMKARLDIGGLSLRDILRKDYKQWKEGRGVNLGVSSVVEDMEFMVGIYNVPCSPAHYSTFPNIKKIRSHPDIISDPKSRSRRCLPLYNPRLRQRTRAPCSLHHDHFILERCFQERITSLGIQ